jgi:2-dehydropantoate 2-reductase
LSDGARVAAADHDVTLLARAAQAEAARRNLHVRGLTSFDAPLAAISSPAEARARFDVVVLTCKAHQTATLAPQVAPLLAGGGTFLTLQNGLGNLEKVRRFVPADRVAVGLTSHGVTSEGPGRLYHAGSGPTLVGPAPGAHPSASRVAEGLLADAGIEPEWHAVKRPFVWRKAIINAGINPVGALHDAKNGAILDSPELWGLAQGLVEEALALASKAHVELPAGDLVEAMKATLAKTRDNRCSMLQDVSAKRPTEVEQITGRLVRLGEKVLASMPRSDAVYGRVKDLEGSYLGAAAAQKMAWDELPWEQEPF